MRRRMILLGLAATLLTACTRSGPPPIHVVRHFDTPEGVRDAQLTETGRARAQALVRWFAGKPLTAIYVSPADRARDTAAPLAAERRLAPKVYDPLAFAALAEKVRAEPGAVLIVGHSNTVPDIVATLGGTKPAPLSHPDFGDIWTIDGNRAVAGRIEP